MQSKPDVLPGGLQLALRVGQRLPGRLQGLLSKLRVGARRLLQRRVCTRQASE